MFSRDSENGIGYFRKHHAFVNFLLFKYILKVIRQNFPPLIIYAIQYIGRALIMELSLYIDNEYYLLSGDVSKYPIYNLYMFKYGIHLCRRHCNATYYNTNQAQIL